MNLAAPRFPVLQRMTDELDDKWRKEKVMNIHVTRFVVLLGFLLMTAVSSGAEEPAIQAVPVIGESLKGAANPSLAGRDAGERGTFSLFPKSSPASPRSAAELLDPATPKVLPGFARLITKDARHFVMAPVRWDRSQWTKAGLTALAVGGVILLDDTVRETMADNSNATTRRIAETVNPFGAEYSWGVLGSFYVAGKFFHNDRAGAVAQDGLASSLIAAGAITPFLKRVTERTRPEESTGTYDYGKGGASYPSGHTTQAFAIASVIASHYESRWVKTAAYGLAGLVGWARIETDVHYVSDVVAGALIGTLVGRTVVRLNKKERFSVATSPSLDPSAPGLALTFRVTSQNFHWLSR